MKWNHKREKFSHCAHEEFCDCMSNKVLICETCCFYRRIDDGYGWCRAFPVFELMPWCRDTCGQFKKLA